MCNVIYIKFSCKHGARFRRSVCRGTMKLHSIKYRDRRTSHLKHILARKKAEKNAERLSSIPIGPQKPLARSSKAKSALSDSLKSTLSLPLESASTIAPSTTVSPYSDPTKSTLSLPLTSDPSSASSTTIPPSLDISKVFGLEPMIPTPTSASASPLAFNNQKPTFNGMVVRCKGPSSFILHVQTKCPSCLCGPMRPVRVPPRPWSERELPVKNTRHRPPLHKGPAVSGGSRLRNEVIFVEEEEKEEQNTTSTQNYTFTPIRHLDIWDHVDEDEEEEDGNQQTVDDDEDGGVSVSGFLPAREDDGQGLMKLPDDSLCTFPRGRNNDDNNSDMNVKRSNGTPTPVFAGLEFMGDWDSSMVLED